ncbi:MAG: HEAT repeat domain-containing protein, partial [Ktedonobacterales bacterium]
MINDDSDAFLPTEDGMPEWVSSLNAPASSFSSRAIDHSLDLLGLIEDPSSEYWLLDEWDRTGEPVRFNGAIHLAREWSVHPPAPDITIGLMPFVLLLLGWPQSEPEALLACEALVAYLQHDVPLVRWAATLSLGWLRDERAIPTLKRMLTEYLPQGDAIVFEEQEGHPYDVRLDWWRSTELMKVILHLNSPSFAVALQAALGRMLDLERR